MLFRAIALSLALLVGFGAIIPFTADSTEASPRYKNNKTKKLKKHSKAWWRWYNKLRQKNRALLARKRALRAKQILLARQKARKAKQNSIPDTSENKSDSFSKYSPTEVAKKSIENSSEKNETTGELRFRVKDQDGTTLGAASLTIIGQAALENSQKGQNKIGGVSKSSLRQNVINRMIQEQGWIVNDFEKSINGQKVYVVAVESIVEGINQSHLIFFTEVGGKIYSLSTTCSKESLKHIEKEAEKVIESLQRNNSLSQITQK